ncbi:MAG: sulfoxide reductase heme-binding subunit YedZ [Candidatus Rokubacteria bacterium]|nr:sulfoxide reductase heme-binding subunit YedZ [Candidatus Rokubacteria bacterium]
MTRRTRIAVKVAVWTACLTPLALLGWRAVSDDLTANPIDFITDWLGRWTMRLLLASLALTPVRILTGWGWPIAFRRLLGLFAFFHGTLHFGVWIVVDHYFAWARMGEDILKRPYITVGVTALVLMVPLALTSTAGMIRRLGGRNWNRLHRLVYVTAVLAVLHFMWLAKTGRIEQYLYALIVAVVLGVRVAAAARRMVARSSPRGPRTGPPDPRTLGEVEGTSASPRTRGAPRAID